jgi:hypothetical protein
MAMRKEPARRYVSVSALAGDIKAHLTGYPVHARTDTWKYRSSKFVRRHKAAVAAAVVIALALVGFSIGMGLLAKRATHENAWLPNESQNFSKAFLRRPRLIGLMASRSRRAICSTRAPNAWTAN